MANDPLSELKDIHWPEPPGIWPLAIGYYLVMLLIIFFVAALIYFILWGYQKRKRKKTILAELQLFEEQYYDNRDVGLLQAKIRALLKRMVFYRFPEKYGRSLELTAMEPALKNILPGAKTLELIKLLEADRFQKKPKVDGQILLNLAHEQIKRCRI